MKSRIWARPRQINVPEFVTFKNEMLLADGTQASMSGVEDGAQMQLDFAEEIAEGAAPANHSAHPVKVPYRETSRGGHI